MPHSPLPIDIEMLHLIISSLLSDFGACFLGIKEGLFSASLILLLIVFSALLSPRINDPTIENEFGFTRTEQFSA